MLWIFMNKQCQGSDQVADDTCYLCFTILGYVWWYLFVILILIAWYLTMSSTCIFIGHWVPLFGISLFKYFLVLIQLAFYIIDLQEGLCILYINPLSDMFQKYFCLSFLFNLFLSRIFKMLAKPKLSKLSGDV